MRLVYTAVGGSIIAFGVAAIVNGPLGSSGTWLISSCLAAVGLAGLAELLLPQGE